MHVQLPNGTHYLVAFRNVNETVTHDPIPLAALTLVADKTVRPNKRGEPVEHWRVKSDLRRHLTLRQPKRVSVITTICTIHEASPQPHPDDHTRTIYQRGAAVQEGRTYFSKTEKARKLADGTVLPAFDRRKAQNQALQDALCLWSREEVPHFWHAMNERAKRAAESAQSSSGRTVTSAREGASRSHLAAAAQSDR